MSQLSNIRGSVLAALILVVLMMSTSCVCAVAGTYTIALKSGACKVIDAGGGRQRITMDGFDAMQKPGEPSLPSKVYCIAIPPGTRLVSVSVEQDAAVGLPGVHRVAPGRAVGMAGDDREADSRALQAAAQREKLVYSSDLPYPSAVAELVGQGKYRKYSLAYVRYTPVSYHPRSGRLYHYPRVTLSISYQQDPVLAVAPALQAEQTSSIELQARQLIANYTEAQQWYSAPAVRSQSSEGQSSQGSYVVIAPESSMDGLAPLINWEKCKGRQVYTATTEWIDDHYTFTFNTRDLAAKVRTFLRDHLGSWSIADVLVVGNNSAGVPMRYTEPYGGGAVGLFATDHYYAELDETDVNSWDRDTDAHYGEYGDDAVDMIAEVNVGRIPYTEGWTVRAICDRMVAYEHSQDMYYKRNVLLPMAFFADDTDSAVLGNRMVTDIFQPSGWIGTRLYERGPTHYTTSAYEETLSLEHVSSTWSGDHYGLVAWAAHGGPTGSGYSGGPFVDTTAWPELDDEYPSFIVTASCSNGVIEFPPDSVARWSMMHGCVGLMGYTAMSPFVHGWDGPEDGYIQGAEYLFCARAAGGSTSVGTAFRQTMGLMWNTCYGLEAGSTGYKHMFITNLYANPDMSIAARPTNLPNLARVVPTGWAAAVVPRADDNATQSHCAVSSILDSLNPTYVSYAWANAGQNGATPHTTRVLLDGQIVALASQSSVGSSQTATRLNDGPITVRGGRHTLWYEIDADDDVKETNETDNGGGGQYVWEPTWLSHDVPLDRSAPPILNAHGSAQGTMYDNNDGFGFHVTPSGTLGYWSAAGILPGNLAADYDLRLWSVGNYQGSSTGFGPNWLTTSDWDEGCSDFVVVNARRAAIGNYYAGAINFNGRQHPYRIVHSASQQLTSRPHQLWNGYFDLSADKVLNMYECYLTPGPWTFYLNQVSGSCDLGFSLYSQAGEWFAKRNYYPGGYADSSGAGESETFTVNVSTSGWYGLVIWKATARDYYKSSGYRIAFGQRGCITVTSPNGGEILANGDQRNITWQNLGTVDPHVKIELTKLGGLPVVITPSTDNLGSYTWPVSAPEGSQYKIRVTSTSNVEHVDLSDDYFTIENRSIKVLWPVQDDRWAIGDSQKIKWSTTNIPNGHCNVQLSRNGGATWTTLAANLLDTGSLIWTVTGPESPNCKIRVKSVEYPTIFDSSDCAFSIATRSIQLLSPNGGEVWQEGESNQVTWSSTLVTGYIVVEFSRNGVNWTLLTSKAPNTGSYTWTATGPKSTTCKMRVTSYESPGVTDASDSNFTIVKRSISLTSPTGGENWLIGEKHPVKWVSSYLPDGHVSIDLSRDGGAGCETLATNASDTGSLSWVVTGPESGTCMVRVTSVEYPSVQAISSAAFTIGAGSLTITSPDGGEVWRAGRQAGIAWSSANIDGRVNILISRNSGDDWEILATEAPNTGSFSCIASYPTSPNARIRVASLQHPTVSDVSNADFAIQGLSAPGRPIDAGAYTTAADVRFDWIAPPDGVGGTADYFVRVGTAPGRADVFDGWTGGSSPSWSVPGVPGRTYYCRVLAQDQAGDYSPWSEDSDGIAVVDHTDLLVSEAKMLGDKSSVGLPAKTVSAMVSDCVYVQEPDRSAGIRVNVLSIPGGTKAGSVVDVGGVVITTTDGERCIVGTLRLIQSEGAVSPLHISQRCLGGAPWWYDEQTGAGQAGVLGGVGLNNIGLLVKTSGRIAAIEQVTPPASPTWFMVDDGTLLGVKCLAPYGVTIDPSWHYVWAVGALSCQNVDIGTRPIILIRSQGDIGIVE